MLSNTLVAEFSKLNYLTILSNRLQMRYFRVSYTHKVQTNSKRNKNVIHPHIIIKKLESFKLSPTLSPSLSHNTEQLETQQSQKHKWLNSKLRAFDALLSHMAYCVNINY